MGRRALKGVAIGAVTLLLLIVVEGAASAFMATFDAVRGPAAPRLFQYDTLLGWVNTPSLSLDDVWGPERSVYTNRQGFRNREDTAPSAGAGRIRVICTGDSFAYGEGVSNSDTWCARLTTLDRRIESINMGQPGYSVGQAFLRYQRDAASLEHHLHLFTFIGDDFDRLGRAEWGTPRPTLRLEGDSLVVTNVPVPTVLPTLGGMVVDLSRNLRSVEFLRRALHRLGGRREESTPPRATEDEPIAAELFRHVVRLNSARGSAAVFVYLPTISERHSDGHWRAWVRGVMESEGYPFIDLTESFQSLPDDVSASFFIRPDAAAGNHYSEAGHAWAAELIYDALRAHVATSELLTSTSR